MIFFSDMYDPHRLWAFPGTHTPQIQQIFTAQQAPLQPQVIGSTADSIGVSYSQAFQTMVNTINVMVLIIIFKIL